MLGDIIHAATGFAGILAAPAQIKQQWLPAWESQPGRLSAFLFLGCQHRGFVPLSWSDQFHRGVGLGTGQASGFPSSYFISHRRRPPPPVSLSIALFFVRHKPQSPCCPRTWSWTGSLLSSYFLCSFAGAAGTRGQPRGQRLPWQAGAVYGFWKLCGHGGVKMATGAPREREAAGWGPRSYTCWVGPEERAVQGAGPRQQGKDARQENRRKELWSCRGGAPEALPT